MLVEAGIRAFSYAFRQTGSPKFVEITSNEYPVFVVSSLLSV